MKKEYILKGLTCANCAGKIENEISRLDDVHEVSVSSVTSVLALTLREDTTADLIVEKIRNIVYKHEPDVIMVDKAPININNQHGCSCGHSDDQSNSSSCSDRNSKVRSYDSSHKDDGKARSDSCCENDSRTQNRNRSGGLSDQKSRIIQLAVGAMILAAGIATEHIFDDNAYVPTVLFIASYIVLGGKIVLRAIRNISKGQIFDEHFLMSVATIGAFAIGEFSEAVAVMLFYQIGEYFQEAAVRKSKKSITGLMDIRPDYANVKRNGDITKVAPETVNIGEYILVKPGEKIPLDGIITEGEGLLDTKSLTGESLPRSVKPGDTTLSGCINQNGLLTIKVTKDFGESTVAKIIDLVENASSKKAQTENFITKFSRYYTPVVVILATLLALVPPLITGDGWSEWINRGLVFLVISCPCALVISIPLGFFGGIVGASRKGILVKGGNYLEALNNLDIIVFDKTGTLTKGVFEVTKIDPANGFTKPRILEIAAYAESYSNHPIALSIGKAYDKTVDKGKLKDYAEIAGYGISVTMEGKKILAGNSKLMDNEGVVFTESVEIGTKVYVAVDGKYAGCIVISDEVKPDSQETILGLKAKGVRKTVMLTGDDKHIAEKIAEDLFIDEVYAQLLPHEKVGKLEQIDATKRPNGKLAFVGDGINDAPVLARADIGIAMGGLGSDAAIEAADVVLMTDEPSGLVTAIGIAKTTRRIIWQNIICALGVKAIVLILGAFGITTMWEAVFADVGVALLAVLNATRAMKQ